MKECTFKPKIKKYRKYKMTKSQICQKKDSSKIE